jgi:hypothetical protein
VNGTYQLLVCSYDNLLDRIINSTKNDTAVARKDVSIEADIVKNAMLMSGHSQGRELATAVFVKDTNRSTLRS